jgi:hypothetical protein
MAFLFAHGYARVTWQKSQIWYLYLNFGYHEASFILLENRMIGRTARLTLASLASASIILSPFAVYAADPASAPAAAPSASPASAPIAAPSDKAEAKKVKKQAKQQKKAEKKSKKKSKKKTNAAEAAAQ